MTIALTEALEILEGLDPAHVAGTLTNTRVPDAPVNLEQLRALMTAEGLDTSMLPAPKTPRPAAHDFALACRAVETRRGKRGRTGERVAVGEVVTNASESVYQITREVVDETNRVIDHKKGMRVVLAKQQTTSADPISVEPFAQEHYDHLRHLEAEIRLRFDALRGTVPGSKVRAILREQFRRMHATRWSTTNSVWFVPLEHAGELAAMERVLKALYTDAEFDTIPLPNNAGIAKMLEDKTGTHVQIDATKLGQEIAEKLAGKGQLSQATFERMKAKANDVAEYADKMENLLGGEVATAREALRLVDMQLVELFGRVKT
jgi:hypothetical protein